MTLSLQKNRHLSEFSTFGIGGPIRYFAEVKTSLEMEEAFAWVRKEQVPYLIVGRGSNCLFSDRGFEGLVLLNKIDFCTWENARVHVGAGYSFALLGIQTARQGFSGLEFASGIPASVGGAIFMNAGANGQETSGALDSVLYLHPDGDKQEYKRKELPFQYRTSPFQSMSGAILSAFFALTSSDQARQKQLKIVETRLRTQPLKDKSAGCIFRNPSPKVTAGALIDQCGLKGATVGGAKVSEVHANFIVNQHHASAQDVLHLIQRIQECVYEQCAVRLETEIRIVPHA